MEMMELLMDVRKELRGAEYYAKEAKKHRGEYPELASAYHRIAQEKLTQAQELGKHAERMAQKMGMVPVWDIESQMMDMDIEDVMRCLNHHK